MNALIGLLNLNSSNLPHETAPTSVTNFELLGATASSLAIAINRLEDFCAGTLVQVGAHGRVHQLLVEHHTGILHVPGSGQVRLAYKSRNQAIWTQWWQFAALLTFSHVEQQPPLAGMHAPNIKITLKAEKDTF